MHGPYSTGPYVYVCEDCWSKPYLFFPDKEITDDGLTRVPRSAQTESRKTSVEFAVLGASVRLSVAPDAAIEGEVVKLDLPQLRLDSNNVRFRDRRRALDDHELEEAIWSEAATKNLMREILASRGLSEMPIVDSRMTVREGNRRVVCLRRLSRLAHEGKLIGVDPDTFDSLLVITLRPNVKEQDIALYLARVHVSGKRQWMAINKAAHIFELHTRGRMSFDEIWQFLSINRATAGRMIKAYRDTLAYREQYPDDAAWASKYSYFDEIYKRSELRDWVQRKGNLQRLMGWIYREKIRTGFDIRKLPVILQDRYATELLSRYNAEKAYSYLAKKDPRLADGLYRKMSDVIGAIQRMHGSQLAVLARDSNRIRLVRNLSATSIHLLKKIDGVRHFRRDSLDKRNPTRKKT
jgi:hypothetical protein